MLNSPSDDSICVCENCMELYFDRHKIDVLTNDVLDDLNTLYVELQQDMEKCENQETRDIKFQKLLVKLEAIENAVVYIHNDLKDENNLFENLDSNFGISVQIETLAEDLENQKKMHDNLRIEWYSQEEHLSRLVDKVHIQDTALDNQSIYCTTQGFTLSKMLWKISNRNELLDQILLNEILTQGIFQTFKNCLEAFTLTYRGNMPKPTSPEYQYVLSLAGTISNVSAVPDGRFFIINHVVGETVLNEIINNLPKIRAPNAESLKWIMLTIIHNMLVCKEGEEYAKRNPLLLSNVIKCTNKPNSERIIVLALKILASLTTGVSDEMYMNHIIKSIPVKGLRQLKKSGESSKVSKHATCVLSSIMKINHNYRNIENEKLIRTTQLDDSRSSCIVKPKPSRSSEDKSCYCSDGHKAKERRSSSTVRLQITKHSQDKSCSDAHKIKDRRSSSTVQPQPSRISQDKTCLCSDVNKMKERRSSSAVEPQPSIPSSSQLNTCCCCRVNKTNEGRSSRSSRSRSSSADRRKSSKPSRSSEVNTCCCCPVYNMNDDRSSSTAGPKPFRPSRSSQVKTHCPVNKVKDGRSSSTTVPKPSRPSRSSQVSTRCSTANEVKDSRSSSTTVSKPSRPSRSSQVCTRCSAANKVKDGRSSSTTVPKPSRPSRSSQVSTRCSAANEVKDSRSSSTTVPKPSRPSRSSQVNTRCAANKVRDGRSSSTTDPQPSRLSKSSQDNTRCATNKVRDSSSNSTTGPQPFRPSRSSQVNTCGCSINKVKDGRSSSTAEHKSPRPSRSSQVNTCCCCPKNNMNAGRSSSTVMPTSSKPRSSQGNTCCCYVNKIKRYMSNENLLSTSVSDIDRSNGNYTSSIFSKHPTQSSITIMSVDKNFNSKSSSICFCPSELTNMACDENKVRHKKKQFYASATNSVTCRAPQLNLTFQFKSNSSTSSMDDSLNKDISLHLDFDPIRGPNDAVVDDKVQEDAENQSTKCIQCNHEEIASTSKAPDEVKNKSTNAEHD